MPTIQKPQLSHASFCWHEQSEKFYAALNARRAEILEKSGFNREFGSSDGALDALQQKEADAFVLELTGILSRAAAIKVDGGFKAPNKVIATLDAIERDPTLVFRAPVEPEALGVLACNFRFRREKPGAHRFWLDRDDASSICNPQAISQAAWAGIKELRPEVRRGRPKDVMLDDLGARLLACYLRFNDTATRHSIATDGERGQTDAGPYCEFLNLVVAPLSRFFLERGLGCPTTGVSIAELARRSLKRRGKPFFFQGKLKGWLSIDPPNSSHKSTGAPSSSS